MPSKTARRRRLLLILLASGLLLWLGSEALRFSLEKSYSVDEFQYAHGGWKIARGEVIYRDFFEHHFPLVHQVMALAWVFLDDNPHNILILRLVMLPFAFLSVLAAASLNRRWGHGASWVTTILLLATPNFLTLATEIRPDPLALTFFLGALAVLGSRRLSLGVRGFLSGWLLTIAVWGSQKVLYYGMIFPAAFVADAIQLRRRPARRSFLLGHPVTFALGSLVVLLVLALYLLVTGSAGDWFYWCLRWSFVHQEHYPTVSWVTNLQGYLQDHLWLHLFAGLGVWRTIDRLRRRTESSPHAAASPAAVSPDALLLGGLVTAWASYVWQTAPYFYSLLPVTALSSIFAARGLLWSFRALRALGRRRAAVAAFGTALLVLLLLGELTHTRTLFARVHQLQNDHQHRVLQQVADMTTPEDPVYNITGGQVSRPSVHFFYFTDAVIRELMADRLAREIPAAILREGCTLYLHDDRFESLPEPLRAFLLSQFQPLSWDVWVWGQRYLPAEGQLTDAFLAVRDGVYYVEPAEAVAQGELRIDGRRVTGPVVELSRGTHAVEYRGEAQELFLLWLPRDGERRGTVARPGRVPTVVPGGRGLPAGLAPRPDEPAG